MMNELNVDRCPVLGLSCLNGGDPKRGQYREKENGGKMSANILAGSFGAQQGTGWATNGGRMKGKTTRHLLEDVRSRCLVQHASLLYIGPPRRPKPVRCWWKLSL
ncbi:hypothetical protein B0I35DRAFT_34592 [Stachybotrys elegans]|uniref:Uncharacterized protein n=1 Tax=Stachybotrys elegans TaxID=80388 RepID=A0A8K0WXA4_9HYPO|nr:hypothetical protein B0I35DRAFT_34592 [Stachybotrys elegans]